MLSRLALVVILFATNVFIGVGVVYSKHSVRKAFIELQNLQKQFDGLQVEWQRLQLEQSTWATHSRVERLAREELDMRLINRDRLIFLRMP